MIRGNKRPVPQTQPLKLDFRASIHNRFDVEVIDAATGELKQKAQAFNVICNTFWDRLFHTESNAWKPQQRFAYVLYGKGSGTPAATDTGLFNRIGALSASPALSIDRKNGVGKAQAMVTLNAEDAVGQTITELGIGYDTTHCVTHAMLQDMNGNPISIVKTNTDVINIYATVFLHWPNGGWYSGAVNFYWNNYPESMLNVLLDYGHTSYPNQLRIGRASTRTGDGWNTFDTQMGTNTTTANRSNKTVSVSGRYAAATANMAIRALYVGWGYVQNQSWYSHDGFLCLVFGSWFSPPAITAEAVGTGNGSTKAFSTKFPVKSNATVYVNGTEASGVTVRSGPPDATKLITYFNQLIASNASALSASGMPLYEEAAIPLQDDKLYFYNEIGPGGVTHAYENPFYSVGVASFYINFYYYYTNSIKIQASDDCASWSDVGTAQQNGTISVPAALRTKRYFRFVNMDNSNANLKCYITATAVAADTTHNIVFETAPASGAVITCTYTPDCIAKDSDHVFDATVTLTLDEYQE